MDMKPVLSGAGILGALAGAAIGQPSTVPFPTLLDLSTLNGTNGFVCNGIDAYDFSGASASSAGDVNGDGFTNSADFNILAGDFGCGS